MDSQCSTYCYQVVKPLLQYADSVQSKTKQFSELQDKIKEQAAIIVNLNELINHKNLQLEQQIELSASYKSLNQSQQKQILQNENQIANLLSEVKLKDKAINDLQSQDKSKTKEINDLQSEISSKDSQVSVSSEKIKELKDKITAYQQTSSCIGKLTELHTIEVHNTKPQTFTVPCDSKLAGSGWIVIQRRMDGSVNFNRTWSEYKEGFGNLSGEFFIGLEKLHLLTQSQPHELYISLMDFKNKTRYARYSNFVIGSEKEYYELKVLGSYSGNAGDSMKYHKNMKFSTTDRDHDIGNCAIYYSSGWWFDSCYRW